LAEIDAETNKRLAELQKAKDGPIDEAASFDKWIDAAERIDEELAWWSRTSASRSSFSTSTEPV